MTIKKAIIRSLEDLGGITNSNEVYNHIIKQKYYDFKLGKTPVSTVSALLGDFIRQGDTRVKRFKNPDGNYSYFLTKNESQLGLDLFEAPLETTKQIRATKIQQYEERSLHMLLSSYLKSQGVFSKTIFHEQSKTGGDTNQIWTHPDVVGIAFLNLRSTVSSVQNKFVEK